MNRSTNWFSFATLAISSLLVGCSGDPKQTTTTSSEQTFTTLVSFNDTNGAFPAGALVQGLDGNLYGTTALGGTGDNSCGFSFEIECGTVFKITPGGKLSSLLSFDHSEGGNPDAGLVLDIDGNFYGTANEGASQCGYGVCGTVFRVTSTGKLTVVYVFCAQTGCTDGTGPHGGLIRASDGNLYGTTAGGGNYCGNNNGNCGTVFKIDGSGALTTLYNFCGNTDCSDGGFPQGGLIQGTDGNFYGTTSVGGTHNGGTIFKVTSTGELTTLYSFCSQTNCTDGESPYAGLVQAADGTFYGTTLEGGANTCSNQPGCGTVFKITAEGKLTTLYNFCTQSKCADGSSPQAGLIQGTDGMLYGTTTLGGFYPPSCPDNIGCGTVFKITAAGELTTLHSFCSQANCADGADPVTGLVQATDGTFYGTTAFGGGLGATSHNCPEIGCGTVFSLSTGLGPFVSLRRNSGKVGQVCHILGQGFTGTTRIFLNGISASFTVVSDSFIRAIVPPGATTGFVTVETTSGTLTSKLPFQVVP